MGLQSDKATNKEYNECKYIDNKLTENGMKVETLVTIDGWQFKIDRKTLEIIEETQIKNPEEVPEKVAIKSPILTGPDANVISSGYCEGFQEWMAFDGISRESGVSHVNGWEGSIEGGNKPYLGYNFNKPIQLQKVVVWGPQQDGENGYYRIYTGVLQGSNDYTNGNTEATWEDIQEFSFGSEFTLYDEISVNTTKTYSAYRLLIYTGQGRYNYVQTSELEFYGLE